MIMLQPAPGSFSVANAAASSGLAGEKLGTMTGPTKSNVFVSKVGDQDYGSVEAAVAAAKSLTAGPSVGAMAVFMGPGQQGVFGAYLVNLSSSKPGFLFGKAGTPIHIEGVTNAAFKLHPFAAAVVDGETVVIPKSPFNP